MWLVDTVSSWISWPTGEWVTIPQQRFDRHYFSRHYLRSHRAQPAPRSLPSKPIRRRDPAECGGSDRADSHCKLEGKRGRLVADLLFQPTYSGKLE